MGFNFGAMLGGAASQIVDDINEKEKDVKLRTRTILDRQVAQTAANQKEQVVTLTIVICMASYKHIPNKVGMLIH